MNDAPATENKSTAATRAAGRLESAIGRLELALESQTTLLAQASLAAEQSTARAAEMGRKLASADADRAALKAQNATVEQRLDQAIGRLRALVEA